MSVYLEIRTPCYNQGKFSVLIVSIWSQNHQSGQIENMNPDWKFHRLKRTELTPHIAGEGERVVT